VVIREEHPQITITTITITTVVITTATTTTTTITMGVLIKEEK